MNGTNFTNITITNVTTNMYEIDTGQTIGIYVAAYILSVLASISGIGGGGLLIPVYSLITKLNLKDSVILSIITIAGNALVRSIYFSFKRHHRSDKRYLPNYEVIRITVPFDGNLAYIGYLLNQVLPDIAIVVLIVILLGIMIYKTGKKAWHYYRNIDSDSDMFIIYDNIMMELPDHNTNNNRIGDTPWDVINNYAYILTGAGIIGFLTFIRKESDLPFLIFGIQVLIVSLYAYSNIRHIQDSYQLKRERMYDFIEGDIIWSDPINILKYAGAASIVGILSTTLGIGGGMIMNPIMIGLNMLPNVVVATSSITTFFSSVISALQFIVSGGVLQIYFIGLFILGGLASLTSIFILRCLGKNSKFVITIILTLLLIGSLIMITVTKIIEIAQNGNVSNDK